MYFNSTEREWTPPNAKMPAQGSVETVYSTTGASTLNVRLRFTQQPGQQICGPDAWIGAPAWEDGEAAQFLSTVVNARKYAFSCSSTSSSEVVATDTVGGSLGSIFRNSLKKVRLVTQLVCQHHPSVGTRMSLAVLVSRDLSTQSRCFLKVSNSRVFNQLSDLFCFSSGPTL
jgi:hypothetical protein